MTSTTSAQFGMVAQVEIIPPFGDGVLINPDLTGRKTQLRVDWTVSKGIGARGLTTIKVYNLKKSNRDRAAGITRRIIDYRDEFEFLDGRLVTGSDLGGKSEVSTANGFGALRLSCRYSGTSTTANLFEGTATRTSSVHNRHTWVTTIEGGDGVIQDTSAIGDKVWTSTVSVSTVLEYLIKRVMVTSLGAPIPAKLAAYELTGGYDSSNRYATDIIDAFVKLPGMNLQWWWDDGVIFINEIGQPLPVAPIIVSPAGDRGAYRLLSKPRRLEGGDVEIVTLNLPQLRPSTPVTIEARELGGTYLAASIVHGGSNKGRAVSKTVARLSQIGVVPFL